MSSNTILFKALAAQFDGGRRAHPPKRNTPAVPVLREREIRRDVPEGVKEGAEQRMKGTEGKQEREGGEEREKEPSGGGAKALSCCALSHFCRT